MSYAHVQSATSYVYTAGQDYALSDLGERDTIVVQWVEAVDHPRMLAERHRVARVARNTPAEALTLFPEADRPTLAAALAAASITAPAMIEARDREYRRVGLIDPALALTA